jgi:hypothetical protein
LLQVTLQDFANSFGTTTDDIPDICRDLIANTDFRYTIPKNKSRDNTILGVLKRIDEDIQIIGAEERKDVWEKGWSENLDDFKNNNSLESLVPKFYRKGQAIRYKQDYIIPSNPTFELDYMNIFILWLFNKYFKDCNPIYEFGSGTGFNLVALSKLFPEKILKGSDFVSSSVELTNQIGKTQNLNISGFLFDMIQPNWDIKLEEGCGILTSGAIEQLASKFDNFLQYLLTNKPKLCIHIEPTIELYDENNLVDYLAMKFYKKRGYTQGLLPAIQKLEKQGKAEIIKVKRLYFGSLMMEGYMYYIWRQL